MDYIDAYGLGRWGEGHGLALEKKENLETVIRQVTGSYARHFKKVLTVMNLSQSDYRFSKPLVYDKLGFLPRRDGIGSFGFLMKNVRWCMTSFSRKELLLVRDAGGLTHKMVTIQSTSISKETNVLP